MRTLAVLCAPIFATLAGFAVWQAVRGNAEWAGVDTGMALLIYVLLRAER